MPINNPPSFNNPTFTGQGKFANGTAAAPSITFTSDTTSGIYHDPAIGANSVIISSGGFRTITIGINSFEFQTIAGNKMFSMNSQAGVMDVPSGGGVRVWSGVSALIGSVVGFIQGNKYQMGGTTASFPMVSQNGTGVEIKLADNSAFTTLKASQLITTVLTVATLPAAATAGAGSRSFVSDANAPAFGAIVVGGGTVGTPVYSDGTNWRVG